MAEISTIARPYAQAIFDLAKEKNQLNEWSATVGLLAKIVEDEQVKAIIQDTKVDVSDKEKFILDVCKGKITNEGENFIKLLIENKRLLVLPFISDSFEELKANEEGTVAATIVVATKNFSK